MKLFSFIFASSLLFLLALIAFYGAVFDTTVFLSISTLAARLLPTGWLAITMGLFALACSISAVTIVLYLVGYRFHDSRTWSFEGEQGTVRVSLRAIEDFILRKCQTVPELRDCSLTTEVNKEGLHLSAKVILELQRTVPEFQQEFQQMLHRELHDTLGLPSVGSIRIYIHKILPTPPDDEEPTIVTISRTSKEQKKRGTILQAK